MYAFVTLIRGVTHPDTVQNCFKSMPTTAMLIGRNFVPRFGIESVHTVSG